MTLSWAEYLILPPRSIAGWTLFQILLWAQQRRYETCKAGYCLHSDLCLLKHRLKNLDRIAGLKNTPPSFQIPVKCTFDYINSSSPLLQTKDSISPTTIQGSGQALGQSDVPSLSSPPANSPDATLKRLYVECFLAAAEKTAELEGKIKPVVRPVKGLPRTTDEMRGWIVEQARLAAAHRHAWKKLEEIENEKAEKQVRNEVQAKADLLVIVALNTVDEEGEEHREDSVNKDLE